MKIRCVLIVLNNRKACDTFKLKEKWDETSIAKKFAKRTLRANLNDLDRFKVMINRKKRSFKVRQLAKKMIKK